MHELSQDGTTRACSDIIMAIIILGFQGEKDGASCLLVYALYNYMQNLPPYPAQDTHSNKVTASPITS